MDKDIFPKKISITHALLLTFLPLLAISIVFILFIIQTSSQRSLYNVAKDTMSRNLDWTERYVQSMVVPAQEIGSYLSRQIYLEGLVMNDEALSEIMLERLKYSPHLYSLYVGRPDGSFILSGWRPYRMRQGAELWLYIRRINTALGYRRVTETWVNPKDFAERQTLDCPGETYDPRSRPWYKKVASELHDSWTAPYIFYMTQKAGITYASPVLNAAGVLQGIVGVDLRLNTLAKFLAENRFSPHSISFIFTDRGEILSHPNLINQLKINEIPSLESMNDPILLKGYATYLQSREYAPGQKLFLVVQTPDGPRDVIFKVTDDAEGSRLIIGEHVPESDYLASLQDTNRRALLGITSMLLVALIIGVILARRMAVPITNLSRIANKVKELDFENRIKNESCIEEIHQTIESFNGMMQSLQEHRRANERLTDQLKQAHLDTLYRLAMAAECKDSGAAAHLDRVAGVSALIGEGLGLDSGEIELLRHASIMHDVGKLSIPDHILQKNGELDEEERLEIQRHTVMGAKILEGANSEIMEKARIIALSHHEKWDGSGYPHQLAGERIPLAGRIVAVADVFDALLSKRSYKDTIPFQEAVTIIRRASGQHFDPACIAAFEKRFDDILGLYRLEMAS